MSNKLILSKETQPRSQQNSWDLDTILLIDYIIPAQYIDYVLVALMFDEIGSLYSYRRDLQEYYRHFGRSIGKIGHHLVKDEGMHFNNAAELLLNHHRHRFGEVQDLLEQISALEKSLQKYHQTFFLDHAQEQYRFPPHFNSVLIRLILAKLGLEVSPSSPELQELWQWVPTGHQLVPIFKLG
jgi:hypothetical protein